MAGAHPPRWRLNCPPARNQIAHTKHLILSMAAPDRITSRARWRHWANARAAGRRDLIAKSGNRARRQRVQVIGGGASRDHLGAAGRQLRVARARIHCGARRRPSLIGVGAPASGRREPASQRLARRQTCANLHFKFCATGRRQQQLSGINQVGGAKVNNARPASSPHARTPAHPRGPLICDRARRPDEST